MEHHQPAIPTPQVEIGQLVGYHMHTLRLDRDGPERCLHLEQREVTAEFVGMWGPKSQVFHYMRPYVVQTAPEIYTWREWTYAHPGRDYTVKRGIRLYPYPWRWPSYCGQNFLIDWDGYIVSSYGRHWERQRPWHCRRCRAENLDEHLYRMDLAVIRRIG